MKQDLKKKSKIVLTSESVWRIRFLLLFIHKNIIDLQIWLIKDNKLSTHLKNNYVFVFLKRVVF